MFEAFFIGREGRGAVYAFYGEVKLMVGLAKGVRHSLWIIHITEGDVKILVPDIENVLGQPLQLFFLRACQSREREGVVAECCRVTNSRFK